MRRVRDTRRRRAWHQRLTGAAPEVLVAGVDRDGQAIRLGRARLSLHGIRSALRLGDSLADGCGIRDADRVIVDPGALDREALDRWADLVSVSLGPTGRAVLVLGVSNLHRGLVETLPPRRIVVVPRGVLAPGAEATALWVVDRADADSPCDVIDLRGATRLHVPDDRLASFLHVVAHSHVTARIESGPLASELDHILPDDPRVTVLAHRELPRHLKALAAGPLLTLEEAEALEDNQRWALQLTRELERLVSPADDASEPYLPGAPDPLAVRRAGSRSVRRGPAHRPPTARELRSRRHDPPRPPPQGGDRCPVTHLPRGFWSAVRGHFPPSEARIYRLHAGLEPEVAVLWWERFIGPYTAERVVAAGGTLEDAIAEQDERDAARRETERRVRAAAERNEARRRARDELIDADEGRARTVGAAEPRGRRRGDTDRGWSSLPTRPGFGARDSARTALRSTRRSPTISARRWPSPYERSPSTN